VTGSSAAAATASTVAALAQISYMASGSGSAPAGDGTSPLSHFSVHICITFVHTITVLYPARSAPRGSV
jgi:hypothetical protein